MAKNRAYSYTHAGLCSMGRMVCSRCGGHIQGAYRFHETPRAFVTTHHECCTEDPVWAALEVAQAAVDRRAADLLQAARAFRDTWGVDDLDELIAELADDPEP